MLKTVCTSVVSSSSWKLSPSLNGPSWSSDAEPEPLGRGKRGELAIGELLRGAPSPPEKRLVLLSEPVPSNMWAEPAPPTASPLRRERGVERERLFGVNKQKHRSFLV
eukprot:scaffold25588_cov40-Tisochrysis_lutea.AAC.1